jgi:hypothetical protein
MGELIGALVGLVLAVVVIVVPPIQLWDRVKWEGRIRDLGSDVTHAAGGLLWSPPLPRLGEAIPTRTLRRTWLASKEISLGTGGQLSQNRPDAGGDSGTGRHPSGECNTCEAFVNTAPGTYEVYAGGTGG